MSAYPTLAQLDESTWQIVDDIHADRAPAGALQTFGEFTVLKRAGTILHGVATSVRDALMEHYANHRSTSFDFLWAIEGVTYQAWYAGPPTEEWRNGRWLLAVPLIED